MYNKFLKAQKTCEKSLGSLSLRIRKIGFILPKFQNRFFSKIFDEN